MKNSKKFISFLLAVVMTFSLSVTALAADTDTTHEEVAKEYTELVPENVKITKSEDGGMEITFDLLQQVEPSEAELGTQSIIFYPAGNAELKMRLFPSNGAGSFDWSVTLTNGDVIKGCSATFVCEKNSALIDWNYDKVYMSEYYSTGSLYVTASGSESFRFPSDEDRDQHIRFKWSDFYITGVSDVYFVTDGNITGTVADFTV